MEVEFKKDLKHNYMVIKQEELPKEPYCIRMLENQSMKGVLPLQQRLMDNKTLLYYDITGKQTMQNLYTKVSLSYEQLKQLITAILGTYELAYEYLLPEDDIILDPEYIYIDVVSNLPYLCFQSGYRQDSKRQMSGLLEYLMNKIDYNDKEAVLLIYRLYAVSKEEGYTFSHIYEILDQQRKTETSSNESIPIIDPRMPARRIDPEAVKAGLPGSMDSRTDAALLNIPVVMEKLEEEAEEAYYPKTTYILTGLCGLAGILILILGFTSGLFYNSYGGHIEYNKLMGFLLILLCVEGYLMRKLWSKENKMIRIVVKSEYIDPRQEYMDHTQDKREGSDNRIAVKPKLDPTQLTKREHSLWRERSGVHENTSDCVEFEAAIKEEPKVVQENDNPTCLLSDIATPSNDSSGVMLKSPDEKQYTSICIDEFPFFIGKLRKNVDYCLEQSVVSRYHAKLTKEEDKYYITDLNSTNGTFVNERMITSYEKAEIIQGDRIALANLSFEFVLN